MQSQSYKSSKQTSKKMKTQSKFGKQRLNDFYIDKTFTNLNHGSYGYCPKVVMEYKRQLQEKMEFNTQQWMREDLEVMINNMRAYVSKRVSCPKQNIFLVQNATDAINCLLKSLKWKAGDVVCIPNTAYACVRQTCNWIRDYYGVQIFNINFTMDDLKTSQSIQIKIQDSINQFPKKIRLAIFDHISSMPSIVFPIQAIKLFLDQKHIDLIVDGAHAVNQVDIDLMDLDCAAYFSNFHKWSYAPKNTAFLYISNEYINQIRPALTGNFRGQGIDRQFFWTGTRDCTSYLCVQKGIEYMQSFGFNQVRNYNHSLILAGARLMASIWGTSLLSNDDRCIGYIACVLLPSNDEAICNAVQTQMYKKYNTYIVVGQFDGKMFTRVCAQLYNQIQDYRKAAELFLQILKTKKAQKKQIKNKK